MSRLIVKNLPNNCTEKALRSQFEKYGNLTDASLRYSKDGKFRNFAFIGYLDVDSAQKALKQMNQAFMGSSKLVVEVCRPFGDDNKPRSWSQYSKDSSAYKRKHGEAKAEEEKTEKPVLKKKKDEKFDQFLEARGVPVEKEEAVVVSADEAKLLKELLEGVEGDTSLSLIFKGLPAAIKGKNIKEWLNPVRIKAMKIARNEESAAAFVSFNRPPDVRRALQRDSQFLGGFKVSITKVEPEEAKEEKAAFVPANQELQVKEEEEVREKILETGRLFLRNLPFQTTEDDLMYLFKKYGEVSEVQVQISKSTGKCKGFAIVEFMFPEAAVAAYAGLDGYVFKGRMMHILPGEEKREVKNEGDGEEGEEGEEKKKSKKESTSFKAKKEIDLKKNAGKSHSWNSLFLGANAIADTLAERLGVSKADVLTSESGESAGVRLALAETRLVQETRDFLIENGVQLDAFSRPAAKRSSTVMLAKNLPSGVTEEELTRMFSKYGECTKVLIPPEGGVSALIIMGNTVDAKKAFQALAYSRFRTAPLYLEWAPYDALKAAEGASDDAKNEEEAVENTKQKRKNKYAKKEDGEEEVMEEEEEPATSKEEPELEVKKEEEEVGKVDDDVIEPETTLFVKNLAFDTTDEDLDRLFRRKYSNGIRYAQISKKLNPSDPSKSLSMGFGFVQFRTKEMAKEAMKELQGELLDGHCLELKMSHRQTIDKSALKRKAVSATEQGENTKLLVRNIPFQAKIKEIESLFGTFGEIKNIRIPKKMGTKDQHRGFGFVDFISADEARRSFESLVHSTHLYGRRLVLEWAKEDDTVEELREKTAEKFSGDKSAKKQKKKDHMEALQKQLQVADDEGQ